MGVVKKKSRRTGTCITFKSCSYFLPPLEEAFLAAPLEEAFLAAPLADVPLEEAFLAAPLDDAFFAELLAAPFELDFEAPLEELLLAAFFAVAMLFEF